MIRFLLRTLTHYWDCYALVYSECFHYQVTSSRSMSNKTIPDPDSQRSLLPLSSRPISCRLPPCLSPIGYSDDSPRQCSRCKPPLSSFLFFTPKIINLFIIKQFQKQTMMKEVIDKRTKYSREIREKAR